MVVYCKTAIQLGRFVYCTVMPGKGGIGRLNSSLHFTHRATCPCSSSGCLFPLGPPFSYQYKGMVQACQYQVNYADPFSPCLLPKLCTSLQQGLRFPMLLWQARHLCSILTLWLTEFPDSYLYQLLLSQISAIVSDIDICH